MCFKSAGNVVDHIRCLCFCHVEGETRSQSDQNHAGDVQGLEGEEDRREEKEIGARTEEEKERLQRRKGFRGESRFW